MEIIASYSKKAKKRLHVKKGACDLCNKHCEVSHVKMGIDQFQWEDCCCAECFVDLFSEGMLAAGRKVKGTFEVVADPTLTEFKSKWDN